MTTKNQDKINNHLNLAADERTFEGAEETFRRLMREDGLKPDEDDMSSLQQRWRNRPLPALGLFRPSSKP